MRRISTLAFAAALILAVGCLTSFAQSSAFTYQGKLTDGGSPANGSYDLVFGLWDQDNGGNQFSENYRTNVNVVGGVFTVELDFGSAPLTGADRWISINVKRSSQPPSEYTLLLPRQKLASAPYAVKSLSAANSAPAGASATPSVANLTMLTLAPVALTTITNLTGGSNGQCVSLLAGNANASIVSNANFKLSAPWTPSEEDVMTVCLNTMSGNPVWYERSRSNNTNLTLTVDSLGGGRVVSGPAGIDCYSSGPGCTATFARGTTVSLFATPNLDRDFAQWVGGCGGSIPVCSFRLLGSGSIAANFSAKVLPLTVVKNGNATGTVTGNNINCGGTCTASYPTGSVVRLTATPASNSSFTGWPSNPDCQNFLVCDVFVNSPATVVANFTAIQRDILITKAGTAADAGSVTSTPAGLNCDPSCSASYPDGSVVALTATPGPGSTFSGWSNGGCTGVTNIVCVVTMSTSRLITATFTLDTFSLNVTRDGGGSGTVASSPSGINCGETCSASFGSGAQITLTATPAAGSTFAGWLGDCVGKQNACVVPMTAARSVSATFFPK